MNSQQGHNHYKLYKSGKLWVAALIVVAGLSTTATMVAHADNANNDAAIATINSDQPNTMADASGVVAQSSSDQATQDNDDQQSKPSTNFDNDNRLHEWINDGLDVNHQVLGKGTIFHIFAKNTTLHADTNGNFATDNLSDKPDFGSRGNTPNHTTKDIYYIGHSDKLAGNGFRTDNNYVVLGDDSNVKFDGDQVWVNGVRMDHLKKQDVKIAKGYIDIDSELHSIANTADILSGQFESDGVKSDFHDMNKQVIDVSKSSDSLIIVNIDPSLLEHPQSITITGLSSKANDSAVVLNVKGDQDINWQTQIKLVYDDGTQLSPSESHSKPNHVLWNFGTAKRTVNINSGYLMGSVLVPNGTVNVNVNADGNLVASNVNIIGGESHRWDLWAPQPSFFTPVSPHGDGDDDFHYHNDDDFVYPPSKSSAHSSELPASSATTSDSSSANHPASSASSSSSAAKPASSATSSSSSATLSSSNAASSAGSSSAKPSETPASSASSSSSDAKPASSATTPSSSSANNSSSAATPSKPTTPTTPDVPDHPDVPDVPDTPEVPDTPSHPDVPAKSDTPNHPDTPAKSGTPQLPVDTSKVTTPDKPSVPDKPATPTVPDSSSTPTPVKPAVPVKSDHSAAPVPTTSATSVKSATPTNDEVITSADHTQASAMSKQSTSSVQESQPAAETAQSAALPQTGNHDSQMTILAAIALGLSSLLSLMGLKKEQ